jgi:hypothetical protein
MWAFCCWEQMMGEQIDCLVCVPINFCSFPHSLRDVLDSVFEQRFVQDYVRILRALKRIAKRIIIASPIPVWSEHVA